MGFKYFFYFILLYILVIPRALSLPNYSGERDIEFNLFKLGGGLVDSSVMKFSKCVPGVELKGLKVLIDDATKLDCNNHTKIEPFCKCINLVAGDDIDRHTIAEDLYDDYLEFLKKEPEVYRKFAGKEMIEDYIGILGYVEPNASCAKDFRDDFSNMIKEAGDISEKQSESFSIKNPSKRKVMDAVAAGGSSIGAAKRANGSDIHGEYSTTKKEMLVTFIQNFILEYPQTLNVSSNESQPRILEGNLDKFMKDSRFAFNDDYHSSLYMFTLTDLMDFNHSDSENIEKLSLSKIRKTILYSLNENVNIACEDMENDYKKFTSDHVNSSDLKRESYNDFVKSNIRNQDYAPDHALSYESFVKKTINPKDPTELANKRFEADIYYCDRHSQEVTVKNVISDTMKDDKAFEELNKLLEKDVLLTKEIKELEEGMRNSARKIHSYDDGRQRIEAELKVSEREKAKIQRSLKSGDLSAQEVQAERLQLKKVNSNIVTSKNQLIGINNLIELEISELVAKTTRVEQLSLERHGVSTNIAKIFKGNKHAADHVINLSRRSIYSEPDIVSYDPETKSLKFNKDFNAESKKFINDRFSALKSIDGFTEAEAKMTKAGKKTITKKFDSSAKTNEKKVEENVNTFSDKKNREFSREIQTLPRESLSVKEKSLQKRFKDLEDYENRITSKIENFQTKQATVKRSINDSNNEKRLSSLKKEISNIQKERENLYSKEKKINVRKENIPVSSVQSIQSSSLDSLAQEEVIEREPIRTKKVVSTDQPLVSSPISTPTSTAISSPASSVENVTRISENDNFRESESSDSKRIAKEQQQKVILDESNVFNDTVLSESDFNELSDSLNPSLLEKYEIVEGEYISVDTNLGRVIYNPIFKNGKVIRFEKVSELSREEVMIAHEEEVIKIQKLRQEAVRHADLMNVFSDIIKK
ncbi:hypothetical protein A9Q84_16940 [Halobacteriovorax marinus]|uniref:Uncharacterized protein n=1 Tax=Halobacteriovorax marinus TaxID=97084 RepID=A0A1Y5FA20_9BACT|nr:hypothetical protein A9Q84_16940 [Halobacteriovorax marinus]